MEFAGLITVLLVLQSIQFVDVVRLPEPNVEGGLRWQKASPNADRYGPMPQHRCQRSRSANCYGPHKESRKHFGGGALPPPTALCILLKPMLFWRKGFITTTRGGMS